jgi:DEAD/DEAH box helicase domain-containing protein
MVIEVIFDVETKKLFSDIESQDPGDLGVSVVSAYRRIMDDRNIEIEGKLMSFWDEEAGRTPPIETLWEWFSQAHRIIGFNSKHFDVPALRGYFKKDFHALPHFDIMEKVREKLGRRLSLNALAITTLGTQKTDVGTNAVYYWNNRSKENLDLLQHYCEADVLLTRDLYDYGMKNKTFKFTDRWNSVVTLDMDFSYPEIARIPQISLF